ncbi:hypothetical protein ACO34A_01620 [Rhizobium sp. ACO-34A]|nr:putative Ig domain-containing protein [Rhizobium sp. ACO-34A]ATN32507.1 hypothetical protein ACO34A_01620 [Rhizobium sp. ACO-34A]
MQVEGVEISDLSFSDLDGTTALEIEVKDIKSGVSGTDTLVSIEKVVLTDNADKLILKGDSVYAPIVIDMGAGNNEVSFEAGAASPSVWERGSLYVNFSTTKENGEEAGETTNTVAIDEDVGDQERISPILLVDGKQLVGGAAFDFDKFDLLGGELSIFLGMNGVPEFLPTGSGTYGVSTTDRVQQWLSQNATAYQQYISGLTSGGGLFGSLIAFTMASMMLTDLNRLKSAWSDQYARVILGTHGELYILENEEYDANGNLKKADLTIRMNLDQEEPYEIKIDGWKQHDFGIYIDTLQWRNGLDSGTNKNGKLDSWNDLSLETIREKLKGLGFEAKEIDIDGADAPGPSLRTLNVDPVTTGGISRSGNGSANTLTGTAGDDVINGHRGDDELNGGDGRDVYVFEAGDGHDVIVDGSVEGNIIRFLDGLDPSQMQTSFVAGSNGGQDLLITYGQGDTILIVGWSSLTPEQQELWAFEGVEANLSSPNSEDTQDISVLPGSQGGTAKSLIEGTTGNDVLTGLDISEVIDAGAGDDELDGRAGDDRLFGREGNDSLNGGSGNDRIDGGSGNDHVRGGLGDDIVIDQDGNDTYFFSRGDGKDVLSIGDDAGIDTLVFEDIVAADIEIVRQHVPNSEDDFMTIVLRVKDTQDEIKLWNHDAIDFGMGEPARVLALPGIERVVFGDGVEWSLSELMDRYYDQAATDGNDYIFGSDSSRTLTGGKGDDVLAGWGDGETFYWERGDGNDIVQQVWQSGSDRLVFGPEILADDITLLRREQPDGDLTNDLVVEISGSGAGSITVMGFFSGSNDVDAISLSDGTTWTRSQITQLYLSSQSTGGNDYILGSDLGDIIDGGQGNDRLEGGDGADIFRFGQGFGQDVVVLTTNDYWDRIEFLAHNLSDFTITRDGLDLVFRSIDTNDRLTLERFGSLGWSQNKFSFENGWVFDDDLIATIADLTTAATNSIIGTSSGQTLEGTASNDRILAYGDADTVSAGDGNDLVNGGAGADLLNGGKGADIIFGGADDDQIRGDDDDDHLFGGSGGDDIQGGAGADVIYGEDGGDILAGGHGADTLIGGAGDDSYLFARGDGYDIIDAASGRSTSDVEVLELEGGITAEELNFAFSDCDLIITFDSAPMDRVTAKNFLASGSLTEIHVGTTTLTLQDILDQATGVGAGDDTVISEDGGVVYGGRGSDNLVGSLERELFVYNRGDGVDLIEDWAGAVMLMLAQDDELILTGGIRPEDLILARSGADLTIYFANSTDRIDIARQFHSWDYSGGVEAIRFDDGTIWTKADIRTYLLNGQSGTGNETIDATAGDDIIVGSAGDDVLLGGEGNDHYIYQIGNDHDVITDSAGSDTLTLGVGIIPTTVTVQRDGDNITLNFSSSDSVTITDIFSSTSSGIEVIQFHDGTRWTRATLTQKLIEAAATNGDDDIVGSSAADVIAGGKGNDHLSGGEGGDTYRYDLGDGADFITETGPAGTDIVDLGAGLLSANVSVYRSQTDSDDLVLDFGNGDRIVLDDHFSGTGGVEWVKFAAGEIWSNAQLTQKALAASQTNGDDVLVGSSLNDRIEGGEGNDTISGGGGVDVYVFNLGDGVDVIDDYGPQSGADIIEFGAGIAPADIDLSRSSSNPDDLVIAIRGTTDKIVVTNHFTGSGIGSIQFVGGVQWMLNEITQRANNVAPHVVVGLADQAAEQGSSFVLNLPSNLFADVDSGDQITISAGLADGSELPSWLHFDGVKFHGTPDNADVGSLTVRLTAMDRYGDRVSQDFTIEVENVNDAPVASLVPANQTATAGVAFTYQLPAGLFYDPDNGLLGVPSQQVTLSAALAGGNSLPAWLVFNPATGAFSGTPTVTNHGVLDIVVTASDGIASTSTHFGISIGGGNTAPTVGTPVSTLNAAEDSEFTFDIPSDAFIDITPGDRLRYAAELSDGSPLPSWLKLDAITGRFAGTPGNIDVGSLQIRIIATDIAGASATATVSLVVGNTNDAPTTEQELDSFVVLEGSQFTYTVPEGVFADEDAGDTLTLSAGMTDGSPLPSWLEFDPVSRAFSGIPDDGDVGIISVRVTATDAAGASTDAIMFLVIGGTNDAPTVANEIPDFAVDQYADFEFTIPGDSFDDVDSSGLSYTVRMANGEPLPNWLSFDPMTATLTGNPDYYSVDLFEGERVYQIEITATDSAGASVSQVIDFTVRGPYPGILIEGTSDDDTLEGTRGPDQIYGGAGNDLIWGGDQGDDKLYGGDGDDRLLGDRGNDTLSGGAGNDTLIGGSGADTYLFARGGGQDFIELARDGQDNSDDVIRFDVTVLPSNITVSRDGYMLTSDDGLNIITTYSQTDLKLAINGTSDSIIVEHHFGYAGNSNGDYFISSVQFENGVVWSAAEISARFMQATSGSDLIQGDFTNNLLSGGAGNDRLLGLGGNDTLDGGTGNDDLYGGYGDDVYLFGIGSGNDRIIDFEGGKTYSFDTLRFGSGISVADLIFTRDYRNPYDMFASREAGSLLIEIAGTNDSIRIFYQYAIENGLSAGIDRFEFDDGTVLTREQFDLLVGSNPILQGTDGNDDLTGTSIDERIIGGKGNDRLYGNDGDDIYVWNLGDGNDRISEDGIWSIDILEFGAGIGTEDVRLHHDGFSIYAEILPTGETIQIYGGVLIDVSDTWEFERPIDEIQFADGASWTIDEILEIFTTGTSGDDHLIGYDPYEDVLDGGAGNDRLEGNGGADTYVFGRGYGTDTIYDSGSRYAFYNEDNDFDVIRFRSDIAIEDLQLSNDLAANDWGDLVPSLVISIAGTTDKLILVETGDFIELLYFEANNTQISASVLRDIYYAQNLTSGNDYVVGFGET